MKSINYWKHMKAMINDIEAIITWKWYNQTSNASKQTNKGKKLCENQV